MKLTKSARPLALERVRRRLERWRRTRPHPRAAIPNSIWADAGALARQQGLYQTARALPIHYGGLKHHLEAADRTGRAGAPSGFVELRPMNSAADEDCVIEVDGDGAPAAAQRWPGRSRAAQSGDRGGGRLIQITPQMRILVAVEAQDFRKGIDGLARICREVLDADPFFCGS